MAQFHTDGLTFAYDDIPPAGPSAGTVLLVHGFATNRGENWRRLGWLTAFQRRGYRAVALDLRGHGESDKPHDPAAYGRGRMIADIVALMDHLALEPVILMGYSMGAQLSLGLALATPGRVDRLILGGVGERLLTGSPLATGPMTMADALRAEDPQAIQDPVLRGFRLFADQQGEDRLALAACSQGGGASVREDDLAQVRAQTLVVAGDRDDLAGDPRVLAEAIPGAKGVSLPACDHFSAIPHALFKAAVFDFIEGWEDDPAA